MLSLQVTTSCRRLPIQLSRPGNPDPVNSRHDTVKACAWSGCALKCCMNIRDGTSKQCVPHLDTAFRRVIPRVGPATLREAPGRAYLFSAALSPSTGAYRSVGRVVVYSETATMPFVGRPLCRSRVSRVMNGQALITYGLGVICRIPKSPGQPSIQVYALCRWLRTTCMIQYEKGVLAAF